MTRIFFRSLSCIFAAALTAMWLVAAPAIASDSELRTVTIATSSGQDAAFKVEIAGTPEQRSRGLMFRREMDPDHGMLFDFGTEMMARMWMQNTLISLDMIFIDADGVIANVARDTVPKSTAVIPSSREVRYVLEVNAGTARRFGIKSGDKVTLPN